MKAAIIRKFGTADCLEITPDFPRPVLQPNQVLMRVHAAGVNPLDWRIRRGDMRLFLGARFPMVLGNDASGVVEDIGSAVTTVRPGDAVFCMLDSFAAPSRRGFAGTGAYAEFAVTREDTLAPKPRNLSHEEAASVPLAALTALQTLRDRGKIEKGDRVLINGASGGVGIFAVQFARHFGATVTAVCGTRNKALVGELGADEVISYQERKLAGIDGSFDIVYDVAVTSSFPECRRLLAKNGIYISNIGGPASMLSTWLSPVLRLAGIENRNTFAWVRPSGSDLALIAGMLERGELRTVIDRVFPLDAVREAHAYSETGHACGKIVLSV